MMDQTLLNIAIGLVAFFGGLWVKSLGSQLEDAKARMHELTKEISDIRTSYVSKTDLREMLSLILKPIEVTLLEIKADLKEKQDREK